MPGGRATDHARDEWDELVDQNIRGDAQEKNAPLPLALVAAQCERYFGAAWYFNPARWATVDGYVPFFVGLDAWRTMQSLLAWERLTLSRAVQHAQPRPEEQLAAWQRTNDAEIALAFPTEAG